MQLTLRQATDSDLAAVNARYAAIAFVPSQAGELIVIASLNGEVCGQGRVVPIDEHCAELGGIYVLPGHQGGGIARHIVRYLIDHAQARMLYCLPFAELAGFYGSMGFIAVDSMDGVPDKVVQKHRWCNANYDKPVLLLKREN